MAITTVQRKCLGEERQHAKWNTFSLAPRRPSEQHWTRTQETQALGFSDSWWARAFTSQLPLCGLPLPLCQSYEAHVRPDGEERARHAHCKTQHIMYVLCRVSKHSLLCIHLVWNHIFQGFRKWAKSTYLQKDVYNNVHNGFIQSSSNLETACVTIRNGQDEEIVV